MKSKALCILVMTLVVASVLMVSCKSDNVATTTKTTTNTKATTTTSKPANTTTTTITTTKPSTTTTPISKPPPTTMASTAAFTLYENKEFKFSLEYPSSQTTSTRYGDVLLYVVGGGNPGLLVHHVPGATPNEALANILSAMKYPQTPTNTIITDEVLGDGTLAKKATYTWLLDTTLINSISFMVQNGNEWIIAGTSYYGSTFTLEQAETHYNLIKKSYKSL